MMQKINLESLKRAFSALLTLSLAAYLLISRDTASSKVLDSLKNTFTSVIPALFPFMVISRLLITWGGADLLGRLTGKLFEKIVHVPAVCAGPFFIGIISSFPLGASSVCELYRTGKIKRADAERMAALCNNTGPSFLLGVVGSVLWGDVRFGVALYLIQIISSLLCGAVRYRRSYFTPSLPGSLDRQDCPVSAADIADSIADSSVSAVKLAGFIAFFSVVSDAVSRAFPSFPVFGPIVSSLLEFSGGCVSSASLGGPMGAALTGFSISFGGLSVICQTTICCRSCGLSAKECFKLKLFEGILSALLASAYALLFLDRACSAVEVMAIGSPSLRLSFSTTIFVLLAASVAALAGIFLKRDGKKQHSS